MSSLADIDVAVLCGGLGKRLRETVPDRPKPLALVGGRPFLDILVEYTASFGFRRFVLCAGYMAEMIEEHFKGRKDLDFVFSREDKPLDTGGALKHAERLIKSPVFLAMNGDSICDMDMKAFLDFHESRHALASVALVRPKEESDYGAVGIGPAGKITGFAEKGAGAAYINAGVYAFSREVFNHIPMGKNYSLERELFPSMVGRELYGYPTGAMLIDIGTAERYAQAHDFLKDLLRKKEGRG